MVGRRIVIENPQGGAPPPPPICALPFVIAWALVIEPMALGMFVCVSSMISIPGIFGILGSFCFLDER